MRKLALIALSVSMTSSCTRDAVVPADAVSIAPQDAAVRSSCFAQQGLARMPLPIANGAATLAADGLIYFFGGYGSAANGNADSMAAFAYDATTATWTTIADLPATLHGGAGAVSIGNVVYAIGAELFAYDVDTKIWTTKTPRVDVTSGMAVAAGPNGKIYVGGGVPSGNPIGDATPATYDPVADAWTALPQGPFLHAAGTGGFLYGGFFVVGILNAGVYVPRANIWDSLPLPTRPRIFAASAVLGAEFVVAGGSSDALAPLDSTEAYDLRENRWVEQAAMPMPLTQAAGASGSDGCLYLFGGGMDGEVTDTVLAYDPIADVWLASP